MNGAGAEHGPIDRLLPDPDGLDFEGLQRTGRELLQALCGQRWTDYNAHDPGVTILDQLCYALTELAYRSALPHEDYLAGPDGRIDMVRQALHLPQDVLPSEPVTARDWRRLLYDRIPQVADVWRRAADEARHDGLLSFDVRLGADNGASHADAAAAAHAVRRVFAEHRPLCQDLAEVRALDPMDYYLAGNIEIHSLRSAAEIYADIYFACAEYVNSGLRMRGYDEALAGGSSMDELFSGPFTAHGVVSGDGQRRPNAPLSLVRLIWLIGRIDGVQQVRSLWLCDAEGREVKPSAALAPGRVRRLRFPETALQRRLLRLHVVGKGGGDEHDQGIDAHAVEALAGDAAISLQKLLFEAGARRSRPARLEDLVSVPAGAGQALEPYWSIQHQFPAIYGINAYGVPANAPAAVHANAHQLKAYLYVFEQVMANYLQNLAEIGRLFSVDPALDRSYFSQVITDDMLPRIEELYRGDLAGVRRALESIAARLDPFEDRRGRVLDVLLAMYGVDYTQQALRKFGVYFDSRHRIETWLLENKLAWLRGVVDLGRWRATGFRYDQPAWNTDNVSGAQRKIAILLGLHQEKACRGLAAPVAELGLRIVPDVPGREHAGEVAALAERLESATRGPLLRIPEGVFNRAFLRHRLRLEDGQLQFVPAGDPGAAAAVQPWTLGALPGPRAEDGLERFRDRLRALNMRCEGFHLVEHLLLRPRATAPERRPEVGEDFHPFQVSIVFPGWSARFADPEFRKFAEETVSLNLPAHVLPHFHWLGFVPMADFEGRLQRWYEALRALAEAQCAQAAGDPADGPADASARVPGTVLAAVDEASIALVRFLQRQERESRRQQGAIHHRWI